MSSIIRRQTAGLLYRSGLLRRIAKARCTRKAVVLMYHRVAAGDGPAENHGAAGIAVTRDTFEKHLDFLEKNFRVMSQSEYLGCLEKKGDFPAGSILITFDDGWKDNYDNAYPALKKKGLPAVVFPAAGFIGSTELFWQDRLRLCLGKLHKASGPQGGAGRQEKRLSRICPSAEVLRVLAADERRLVPAINSCVAVFKKKPVDEVERIVSTLERITGPDASRPPRRNFLSWPELAEMSENGIDVGSHGLSHTILTQVQDNGRIAHEIRGSREILEFGLHRKVLLFSYPNGSYNREVAGVVRRSGYSAAFGTAPGANSCNDDPYAMKRINIHEDMTGTEALFLARVAGLW